MSLSWVTKVLLLDPCAGAKRWLLVHRRVLQDHPSCAWRLSPPSWKLWLLFRLGMLEESEQVLWSLSYSEAFRERLWGWASRPSLNPYQSALEGDPARLINLITEEVGEDPLAEALRCIPPERVLETLPQPDITIELLQKVSHLYMHP